MSQRPPRNIRDIAHLYISRPRKGARTVRRVTIAGVDRDCFPGFHAANLAAALASQGQSVRLIERSGLLTNAACFLALPPQVYAASSSRRSTMRVSALDGLDVWFSEHSDDDGSAGPGEHLFDLVHEPPLKDRSAPAIRTDVDMMLLVARDPGDLPDGFLEERSGGTPRRVLLVGAQSVAATTPDSPLVVGRVTRWERSLSDALPAIVRDPRSGLSRSYIECGRQIVAGPTPSRRLYDRPERRTARARAR